MKILGLLLLIISINSSCFSPVDTNHLSGDGNNVELDNVRNKVVIEPVSSDTCFYFVEHLVGNAVKVVWGQGLFERETKLKGQFEYEKIFCNEERQVLSFACGSPCLAYVILPMNNMVDSVQVLLDPVGHSKDYSFVVTASTEIENELIVYDLDNKTKRKVMLGLEGCEATFYIDCFDLKFEGDSSFTVITTEGDFFRWDLDRVFNR